MTKPTRVLTYATSAGPLRPLREGPPRQDRLPPSPETGDRNPWVTGRCWFWCGRERAPVLWLGPATVAGATAGLYGCEICIRVLSDQIYAEAMGIDVNWGLDHLAHGPPTGRHRRFL